MTENFTPTPSTEEVTSDDRLWALLSYLLSPLVPIIIFLMQDKKNRPFIREHFIQALILGAAFTIIATILAPTIIGACIWGIAWLVIMVLLGVKAYRGEHVTIPVITNFVKQQGWA